MAIKDLNPRQQEVRKDIIRSKGRIGAQVLADRYHVSRTTIWEDRKRIALHAPIRNRRSTSWNEEREIQNALAEFEELRQQIYEELEYAERALDTFAAENRRGAEAFRSVRVQLLGQARGILKDKLEFLQSVGYFHQQARKLIVATKDVRDMDPAEVDSELSEIADILDIVPLLKAVGQPAAAADDTK